MTDDKIVEAVAIAIYNLMPSVRIYEGTLVPWEDMVAATDISASVKVARCRKHAHAALSVARPMIEAAARRSGAEEMRHRVSRAAWSTIEAAVIREDRHDTFFEDHVAAAILALPLEG